MHRMCLHLSLSSRLNNLLKQCQPHKMIIVIYYYHKIEQACNEANDVNMKFWLKGSIPFNRICSSHQNAVCMFMYTTSYARQPEMYNHNNVTLFANVVLEPFFTPFFTATPWGCEHTRESQNVHFTFLQEIRVVAIKCWVMSYHW